MDLNEEYGTCRCCGRSFPRDEWDDDEGCDDLCPECYYSGREHMDDNEIDDEIDDDFDDFDDLDEPDSNDDLEEEDDEWENEEPYLPPDEITNKELDRFND